MLGSLPKHACLLAAVTTLVAGAGSCSDRQPTGTPVPALSTLAKAGGDGQTGAAGRPLPVPLAAQVHDSLGRGVTGVIVTWGASAGRGSVSPHTSSTDASGLATATWTLGAAVGANGATASVSGLPAVAFSATAVAGPAAIVSRQAGDGQSAAAGAQVATAPAVKVTDAFGNPVSGAAVTFAVASGGGTVGGGSQTTNPGGIATVGSWTLGTAGANTLSATVTGSGITGNPITFTATATGGGGGGGTPTLLLQEDFADANLGARGWYDLPSGGIASVTTAQHAPGSTASLEMDYTPGSNTPTPSVATRHQFTPSSSVYLRYWVKYDTNWVGSGLPYHPHELYFFTTDDQQYVSPAANHLTIYVEHNYHSSGSAGGYASVNTQDATNIDAANVGKNLAGVSENRAVSGCNGVPDSTSWSLVTCYQSGSQWENERSLSSAGPVFRPGPGAGYKSNWNLVEVYVQLNSIVNGVGQQDGVIQYWFDSTLVLDRHNLLLRTGAHPTMKFNQIFIGPYMETVPIAERAWMDGLVVMTARP